MPACFSDALSGQPGAVDGASHPPPARPRSHLAGDRGPLEGGDGPDASVGGSPIASVVDTTTTASARIACDATRQEGQAMRLDSETRQCKTAVNVDDAPGRVRHVAADERRDRAADVIDRAPPPFGNQAVGDPLVVHLADVAVMSVAMMPGRTSKTGMPASASRTANSFAAMASAALLTQ